MPEYQRLKSVHFMPSFGDKFIYPTVEQLSNQKYATDDEVSDIIKFRNSRVECQKDFIEKLSNIEPAIIPAMVDGIRKSEINGASLIQKKITWGEYAFNFA